MYKIGDFSKKTNINIKTLRYYDEIDLFKPSYADKFTGYRYYTDEQLLDILLIKELKKLGLSLEEIKKYLKTKDIKILEKRRRALEMEINNITNFLTNQYKKYKITESNYEKYVLINGIKYAKKPQALAVRDKEAKYYVIENDDDFIDDFVIFIKNNNWITINRPKYLDKEYIDFIFNYLKENGYTYITEIVPIEEDNVANAIRKHFTNIEESTFFQGKWEYIKFKIYL